jgi:hypothetical protein
VNGNVLGFFIPIRNLNLEKAVDANIPWIKMTGKTPKDDRGHPLE